ncbi:MAG: hypothetical protein MUO21_01720, partial [Nitrososphaeraceae archaeon]|nr:hypothetical protein [Nitrososphaeraceae archaeon]
MACTIKISNIIQNQIDQIGHDLCFYPEIKYSKYNIEPKEPIYLYKVESDKIHIPYFKAKELFQIAPNSDKSFPITNLTFNGNLRDHQVDVEAEAWEQLELLGSTTLGLYPGFGKTILGAKLASRAKLLTVILVHRELLTVQWKKTFNDFTNATVWIVGEKHPPAGCD